MRYDVLTRTHPDYNPKRWDEIDALFKGGYAVLDRAGDFLPKAVGENQTAYEHRIKTASYHGYFGPIVNMMVAQLFGQELAITPAADSDDDDTAGEDPADVPEADSFYREFQKDVDGDEDADGQCTFADLMRCVLRTALKQQCAYLGYDTVALDSDDAPANRAEEEAKKADRIIAFEIDPKTLIDWECDDKGEFSLAVLRRVFNRRTTLADDRSKQYEEFKVWLRDGDAVKWELYRTPPYSVDKPPQPTDEIPKVGEGTVSFPAIPILCFRLPEELWVGNQVAPMNREHFQRRSELVGSEQRSLFEIPVFQLGSEIGADDGPIPSEVQQNPHRAQDPRALLIARGFAVIGKDDDLKFVGPSGAAYTIADTQLKELVDEIYRVVAMMAQSISSTSTALHRSGASKDADADALAIVLRELGNLVRKFSVRVFTAIAKARKDSVIWQAHGLENYDAEARADLISEAVQIDMVAIPSQTFRRHYKTSLAFKLVPEMDQVTKEQVRREIMEGTEAEETLRLSQQENEQEIADNGPTPEQLGLPPPVPPQR